MAQNRLAIKDQEKVVQFKIKWCNCFNSDRLLRK